MIEVLIWIVVIGFIVESIIELTGYFQKERMLKRFKNK